MKPSERSVRRKHSFFLQYLSVLLIVFALSVAVIHDSETAKAGVHPESSEIQDRPRGSERVLLSEMPFDVFEEEGASLRTEAVGTFDSLLLNHDLFLEVTLHRTVESSDELVIARSITLRREFIRSGYESEALRVFLNFKPSPRQGTLRVYRLRRAS